MNVPGNFGRRVKCPCCANPWDQTGDDSNSTSADNMLCTPCLSDSKGVSGIDPENFDLTVSPRENFYLFSNGGWRAKNPIPNEYSSWNTFIALRDLNLDRLKVILEELESSSAGAEVSDDHAKLADFYNSFMDEKAIETASAANLKDVIATCLGSTADPTAALATLHSKYGIRGLFAMYSSPDKKNSKHSLCTITQSGLGMPDRDYYFDADKKEKRTKYHEYVTTMFTLLGTVGGVSAYADAAECVKAADAVIALETALASAHLTRTAGRDPELTYNKMSISHLATITQPDITYAQYLTTGVAEKGFDWKKYFALIGRDETAMGDVNAACVDALKKASVLSASPSLPHYLCFHAVNSSAQHLSSEFVNAHFNFHDKELKGTTEIRPRWKRALESLEAALGDALGQLYVKKYFKQDAKDRALRIVEKVRDALRERLGEVNWMSPLTRVEAMKKMEAFKVKIGFPDKWIDYSTFKVEKGQALKNFYASNAFGFQLDLNRMNVPTDQTRWFMTPQTINAYYHPSLNEIVFPAAILQAPFFDPNADDAVNFGSLGAVVGHEMTHGFDDQGRKYDSEGNMRDWWVGNDGVEYEKRAAVMIKQAESFEVHGVALKGKLTQGENIADLGGLKLALRALRKHLKDTSYSEGSLINGFTPVQRFFLAWSQSWRENVKKERALQLITLDPHGPNELRCNQPLSNMEEFCTAFEVVPGNTMYKAETDRVDIW